ncbi:MAG: acetyltransferase [Scytonema sp. PMC 1069.18]|nr:acetyltransferase [Scytonema sp. PMC 1069.18]
MNPIYLYGCGGHGKVILDILSRQGHTVAAFVADTPPTDITQLHDIPIYPTATILPTLNPEQIQWIVSIGNNTIRQKIAESLTQQGHSFATAIHPSAQIGTNVMIAPGTVIMANTAINIDTQIGHHVIINTGSTIDHDCIIEDYCHVAPGCTLAGHVQVGKASLLTTGTKVNSGVKIPEYTT